MDGLSVVRAMRHAKEAGHEKPAPSAPAEPPPAKPPPGDGKAARIGRTALPTKHEIICYECGYAFQSTGHVHNLRCSKCKKLLDQADYTIDTECREPVRTTGNIRLAASGVLISGALVGRDVTLAGRIEGGTVKANRRLELEAGAVFDPDLLTAPDLKIGCGLSLTLKGKKMYRHVEVCGELDAQLAASGVVTVRAGGHLKGLLLGHHLVVEEGGGLTAQVEIGEAGETSA
jgi:hypothetical protein